MTQRSTVTASDRVSGCRADPPARVIPGVLLGVSMLALSVLNAPLAADLDARRFAAQALALRAAGVARETPMGDVLAGVPGTGTEKDREFLSALWSPFFENAIVKLGRLQSPAPAALYYNPLLDVALFTLWEAGDAGYRLVSVRASPGERLADSGAAVSLRPPWTAARDGPVAALRRVATERLATFSHAYPADEREAGPDDRTFADAAADMRDARPRLMWNAAMRAHWVGERSSWLAPALERIDATLATRDAASIEAAAPETDAATADALARLPEGFTSSLVLDMTLEAGADERLFVASSPGDGHVYVFVLCRLAGDECALRRFLLASVE